MASGFLIAHENVPNASRIEIVASIVEQRSGVRGLQTRDKAIAQESAWRIAAVRIKTETDDRLAVANHIGDQREDTDGHLAEIDEGVANLRFDRYDGLADVDDPHEFTCCLVEMSQS